MGKKSWDLHSLPGGLFEMVCSDILFTGVQSNVQCSDGPRGSQNPQDCHDEETEGET